MRIGIDCRLPTYQMGGISQYILHLLPALAALDQSNEYVLFQSWKEKRSFHPPNAENFSRRQLYTPCHHRLERWSLSAELFPHKLDLFHSPDFIPPAAGAKKKVVTIHDLNFVYFPQYLTEESRRYYLNQIQWASEKADFLIVDSHATASDVFEHLNTDPRKVKTIHLAANPIYSQPVSVDQREVALKKYNLPKGFILFVGTLEPRKNVSMLISVYAKMRSIYDLTIPLVLVGNKGWFYEEIFETIDNLNLNQDIRHLVGVPDEDLAALYHAAGVLVSPSHYEGFGLPALEAQHCGCPVIVSDRGSLPEIVGEGGMILDPDDFELWAASIFEVLSNTELRDKLVQNGRAQARLFSWKNTARETLKAYLGNV